MQNFLSQGDNKIIAYILRFLLIKKIIFALTGHRMSHNTHASPTMPSIKLIWMLEKEFVSKFNKLNKSSLEVMDVIDCLCILHVKIFAH